MKRLMLRICQVDSNKFLWVSRSMFSTKTSCEIMEGGAVEIPLAQTGEGIADCELLKWFVQEGDQVEEFQPLCEVQSDKAAIEITSRYRGKVSKMNFSPGDIVKVGETLLEMKASESDDATKSPVEAQLSCTKNTLATPVVRNLAKELGIKLENVSGSGPCGRILKEDVLNLKQPQHYGKDEIIAVRGFSRTMAKTMTAAASVPHFHYMEEINMDAVAKLRTLSNQASSKKLTYLPFLIKALSLALAKYPLMNSTVNEDASEIRRRACHNVGVAMATSCGLVVPNIKQVQDLSVLQISDEIYRLSGLASLNKLAPQDVKDGTITVSNFGAIGGKFGSPILNLPEVAILAIGRIQKLPRFDSQGRVYPVSIASVTWGADHRVIDGATVANFCNEWKLLVENPEQWLLQLR